MVAETPCEKGFTAWYAKSVLLKLDKKEEEEEKKKGGGGGLPVGVVGL